MIIWFKSNWFSLTVHMSQYDFYYIYFSFFSLNKHLVQQIVNKTSCDAGKITTNKHTFNTFVFNVKFWKMTIESFHNPQVKYSDFWFWRAQKVTLVILKNMLCLWASGSLPLNSLNNIINALLYFKELVSL